MKEDPDNENPPVGNKQDKKVLSSPLIERIRLTKPCLGVLFASVFTNYAIMNMLVYGFTGFYRYGVIAGCFTVPFSSALCIWSSITDREDWYRKQLLKKQGKLEEAYRIKTIYDWKNYEKEIANIIAARGES